MNEADSNIHQLPTNHEDDELPQVMELDYPRHDLATAARVLDILNDPEVFNAYDVCVKELEDEQAFAQRFRELRDACERARDRVDYNTHHLAPIGIAYTYASAFFETNHQLEGERELRALMPTFAPFDPVEKHLHDYTQQILDSLNHPPEIENTAA